MMVLTTRLSESLLPPALDVMRLPHREGEELRETHEVVERVLDRGEEKQLDQFRPVVDVQHVDARVVEHGLRVSGWWKEERGDTSVLQRRCQCACLYRST